MNFDCASCKPEVQKLRGCNLNNYDLTYQDAKAIPIRILEHGKLHTFCPSKPLRDDPDLILKCEQIFAAWKTGQSLEQFGLETNAHNLTLLNHMIKLKEVYDRNENYQMIASMFGSGEQKDGKRNNNKMERQT